MLRIYLFDGLRAACGEQAIPRFRAEKAGALLAYLAYHPGRTHRRDTLLELLWPDGTVDAGRANLSTALWTLRLQLAELGAPAEVIQADRYTLSLDPALVSTDVGEFEQALDAPRAAPRDKRSALLRAAIACYRGELLHGCYEDWIFPERSRLQGRFQQALGELITDLESTGDLQGAIEYACRALAEDPLNEAACGRLMRLSAAGGRHSAALEHYRNLKRLLQQELEEAPGEAVRRLSEEIAAAQRNGPVNTGKDAGATFEPVGGAVPLGSPFYLVRTTDAEFHAAVAHGDSIVLVKGPRQTGKTSLLARGLQRARDAGADVALTDLQTLTTAEMESADTVLFALASSLAEQLQLKVRPREAWDPDCGPGLNLRRYVALQVLRSRTARLVWAVDEIDRLFSHDYADEVFGLFRSWHNERALDPSGPWTRLTLAMAYATEAHLFITDLNQSPFNVGTRLELEDFSPAQVDTLNRLYGSPLSPGEEVKRYTNLVGGHPYLVRIGLHAMARGKLDLAGIEALAWRAGSIFEGHLSRMAAALARDPELSAVVQGLLEGKPCPTTASFYRLRSAGLIAGDTPAAARFRCRLYEEYLRRHMG